jgi:hypothetical protein
MYKIHGDWKIEVCGNVLVQCFFGAWNEEAAIAYVKDFRVKAMPLIEKDWAMLSIFENWELGVPEITKHIEEHCNWFKTHRCVKDCHVYSPNAIKEMQLEELVPKSDEFYERQVFANTQQAIAWLASYGYSINNSNIINQSSHP